MGSQVINVFRQVCGVFARNFNDFTSACILFALFQKKLINHVNYGHLLTSNLLSNEPPSNERR